MQTFVVELWLGVGLLGLVVGSFLNVVIHRLPIMMIREWRRDVAANLREFATDAKEVNNRAAFLDMADRMEAPVIQAPRYNLSVPRSACPHCGHLITAVENIPVLSYLALRGRCRGCKARISPRYPLVELASAALSLCACATFGFGWPLAGALLLLWFLLALTVIDLDTMYLPDELTLPLIWLGLLFNCANSFTSLGSAVIGAVVGYLLLWSVAKSFKLLRGIDGMGAGDFKLLAALGAWLGWMQLPIIILAASVAGLLINLGLMAGARRGWNQKFPFGPYLAAGGVLSLFYGNPLLDWYLHLGH